MYLYICIYIYIYMCVCIYIYINIYTCKYVYCNRIAVHPGPGGNPGANIKTISHKCYLEGVAFVCELTRETIDLPLGGSIIACAPPRITTDHSETTMDHDGHDGSLRDFFN